jgi:hypothetical protein
VRDIPDNTPVRHRRDGRTGTTVSYRADPKLGFPFKGQVAVWFDGESAPQTCAIRKLKVIDRT